jgi:riboflavin kinase/FMN adenylyltransferase
VWITSSPLKALTPTAIALGNFDGIHLGHTQVVKPILNIFTSETDPQIYPTVVTFNPHPREFFSGQSQKLLTPLSEKVKYLEQLGVKQLVLLSFDRELALLSPQRFVEDILIDRLKSSRISVGQDFRFGYQRSGTASDLQAIASSFGVEVIINSLQTRYSDRISSSAIRQALTEGDVITANQLLGRPYHLSGKVIFGQKLGRTIGFPTANLEIPSTKFLPCQGVYAVKVFLEGNITESDENWQKSFLETGVQSPDVVSCDLLPLKGVMNIGYRPTVAGTSETVEIHILNWSGDIYGQNITVHLERFIRPEQRFTSLEALKEQIIKDCQSV